jgi:hypothetical protein
MAKLKPLWIQTEAIQLCRKLEEIAPKFGAHIGLTGGCLYKDGLRKDCDIVVYRIQQIEQIDREGFFEALKSLGITVDGDYGFCVKAHYGLWLSVDFLFPNYDSEDNYHDKVTVEFHEFEPALD